MARESANKRHTKATDRARLVAKIQFNLPSRIRRWPLSRLAALVFCIAFSAAFFAHAALLNAQANAAQREAQRQIEKRALALAQGADAFAQRGGGWPAILGSRAPEPGLLGIAVYSGAGDVLAHRLFQPTRPELPDLSKPLGASNRAAARAYAKVIDIGGQAALDATIRMGEGQAPGNQRSLRSIWLLPEEPASRIAWPLFLSFFTCALCGGLAWLAVLRFVAAPVDELAGDFRDDARRLEALEAAESRVPLLASLGLLRERVREGMRAVALKARMEQFLAASNAFLQRANEAEFLNSACRFCLSHRVAESCSMFVVKEQLATPKFSVVRASEEGDGNGELKATVLALLFQFLGSGQLRATIVDTCFVKAPLNVDGDRWLVIMATPRGGGTSQARTLETMLEAWSRELALIHLGLSLRTLENKMTLSSEHQRKWTIAEPPASGQSNRLDGAVYTESFAAEIPGRDFLLTVRMEELASSLVIMGELRDPEPRHALAVVGIVGALVSRFQQVRGEPSHRMLEEMMLAIHRYARESSRGSLSVAAQAMYFNHDSGQGLYTCSQQPYPVVISPQERKPMLIVPPVRTGALGGEEAPDLSLTPVSLLPGQVILMCTSGLTQVSSVDGRGFDKMIQRGVLSEITDYYLSQGAAGLLLKYMESARAHAGERAISGDLTAAVLMTATSVVT